MLIPTERPTITLSPGVLSALLTLDSAGGSKDDVAAAQTVVVEVLIDIVQKLMIKPPLQPKRFCTNAKFSHVSISRPGRIQDEVLQAVDIKPCHLEVSLCSCTSMLTLTRAVCSSRHMCSDRRVQNLQGPALRFNSGINNGTVHEGVIACPINILSLKCMLPDCGSYDHQQSVIKI
jgi:hypothetical protein